jgi:hypothetical protein
MMLFNVDEKTARRITRKKRTPKPPTNEQLFRKLLKDLRPMEAALLRERMMNMVALNRQAIAKNPESFSNPIFHHTHFLAVMDKVEKYLHFED